MSEPRGHHQVAQFYQRGFARQRGKTWQVAVLDRRTGERRIQNVANTFKRRDWHTVKDEDGNMNFAVEKALAQLVDRPAAAAFHQLREGSYPLGMTARRDVARFVSAQLTRGRHIRDNLTKFMVEVGQRMVSLAAQNYTDEQWQEAIGEVPTEEQRWSRWPEALVNGTMELAQRLNWATLIFPTSEQLLMHPDIARYPLPGIGTIAAGEGIWPWPEEDSGGGHSPFHDDLARRYDDERAPVDAPV